MDQCFGNMGDGRCGTPGQWSCDCQQTVETAIHNLERIKAAGRRPVSPRTVPDFLIGAHALLQCTALITRDAAFFRDYFKGLKVIVPQGA